MNKKILYVVLALIIVAILAGCSGIPAANPQQPMQRTISVTGNGKVYLVPDVAYIYIGVRSQAENVKAALDENNSQSTAVAGAIKEMGVEGKDIQTTSFNVYPQPQYDNNGVQTGTTYVVENTVYVTVRDLNKLGELLDVVVRSGANSINSISFDILDREKAQSEARKLAIDNAKKQAEELAGLAGVTLGEVISVNTYSVGDAPFAGYGSSKGPMLAAAPEAPISAGQLVIAVDASLTYAIK